MKTTHLVASELFLVFLLAGCANLPTDQACRAGIEKEVKVFDANGHVMRYHRSWDFPFLLSAAEVDEWGGDYQSCLNNLKMARVNRHTYRRSSGNYYGTQNTYSSSEWDRDHRR